jgi:hypothetical protein
MKLEAQPKLVLTLSVEADGDTLDAVTVNLMDGLIACTSTESRLVPLAKVIQLNWQLILSTANSLKD